MRKIIINCIIHTDMVHHFPMVSKVCLLDPSWNTCSCRPQLFRHGAHRLQAQATAGTQRAVRGAA